VREAYWPMLNLGIEGSRGASPTKNVCSSTHSQRTSTDGTTTDSCGSSQISYADIGIFSENSSASLPGKRAENSPATGRNETGYSTTEEVCPEEDFPCMKRESETPGSPDLSENCRPISEKDVLSYARQISLGMAYLERNHVVHRDLACRNVLVMGDYKQVKISDFGLSRDIYTWNVYHQKTDGKLPVKWMAIESIFTHIFSSKSDVWSYGILLWELVTLGGNPYPAIGNNELFHLLKTGYRMERPENCSEELYALMRKCWRTAPADRPNFTELRRHLETMMEASEPTLYLSLQADIPSDYFNINARSDLSEIPLQPVSLHYPSISLNEFKPRSTKPADKYENTKVDENISSPSPLPPPERTAMGDEQMASPKLVISKNDYYNFRHRKPLALDLDLRSRTLSELSSTTCAETEVTDLSSNPVSPTSNTLIDDEVFSDGAVPEPIPSIGATNLTRIFRRPKTTDPPLKYTPSANNATGLFGSGVQNIKESIVLSSTRLFSRLHFPSLFRISQACTAESTKTDDEKRVHDFTQSKPQCTDSGRMGTVERIRSSNLECMEVDGCEDEVCNANSDHLNPVGAIVEEPSCCTEPFPTMAINRAYDFNFQI
ncbi:unnamed protein product, partial [Allacma fusca]